MLKARGWAVEDWGLSAGAQLVVFDRKLQLYVENRQQGMQTGGDVQNQVAGCMFQSLRS